MNDRKNTAIKQSGKRVQSQLYACIYAIVNAFAKALNLLVASVWRNNQTHPIFPYISANPINIAICFADCCSHQQRFVQIVQAR